MRATFLLLSILVCKAATAQMGDPMMMGQLCTAERGEFAPESTATAPVLRFAVSGVQRFSMTNLQQRGMGYLYISRERIRFSPGANVASFLLDAPRNEIKSVGEWKVLGRSLGFAEIDFRGNGTWMFQQMLCSMYSTGAVPTAGDPRMIQDVQQAIQDFDAAVARVKAMPPATRTVQPAATPPKPTTGSLKLVTKPAGAQVYIDDHYRGASSEAEGVVIIDGIEPGHHKLRVGLLEYKEWVGAFDTITGKTAELTANLEASGPKPLSLSEVEEMLSNGIAKTRIIGFVNKYGVDFPLNSENEQRLRTAGADSDLLLAIAKNKK